MKQKNQNALFTIIYNQTMKMFVFLAVIFRKKALSLVLVRLNSFCTHQKTEIYDHNIDQPISISTTLPS